MLVLFLQSVILISWFLYDLYIKNWFWSVHGGQSGLEFWLVFVLVGCVLLLFSDEDFVYFFSLGIFIVFSWSFVFRGL